jgi:hypothetical protein
MRQHVQSRHSRPVRLLCAGLVAGALLSLPAAPARGDPPSHPLAGSYVGTLISYYRGAFDVELLISKQGRVKGTAELSGLHGDVVVHPIEGEASPDGRELSVTIRYRAGTDWIVAAFTYEVSDVGASGLFLYDPAEDVYPFTQLARTS